MLELSGGFAKLLLQHGFAVGAELQFGFQSANSDRQFVVQVATDLFLGLSGCDDHRVDVRHIPSHQGRFDLGIDQTVFQTLQGRLRLEQSRGGHYQPAGIFLALTQQLEQLLRTTVRRADLTDLATNLGDRLLQGAIARGVLGQDPQFGQVATDFAFEVAQTLRCGL